MDWKKAIGFGVLIWVVMCVIGYLLMNFDVYKFLWVKIILAVIAGVISLVLAGLVKPNKATLALGYGLIWVVIVIILDVVVTVRFNAEIFTAWPIWLTYALILLAPLLKVKRTPELS